MNGGSATSACYFPRKEDYAGSKFSVNKPISLGIEISSMRKAILCRN